jgi:hypothetical protein
LCSNNAANATSSSSLGTGEDKLAAGGGDLGVEHLELPL